MLKVPDAIICYSCYHYVLVFAEININFHLYVNGVSWLAFERACVNTHMLFAENSRFWADWTGSDFPLRLEFFRILLASSYKSLQMGSEKLYAKRLGLTSYGDHHLTDHKVGGAKGVF